MRQIAAKNMDIAKNPENVGAKLDTKVRIVTNAIHIRAVKMETADDHGNAIASKYRKMNSKVKNV